MKNGNSLLHVIVESRQIDITKFLIENQANIDICNQVRLDNIQEFWIRSRQYYINLL